MRFSANFQVFVCTSSVCNANFSYNASHISSSTEPGGRYLHVRERKVSVYFAQLNEKFDGTNIKVR